MARVVDVPLNTAIADLDEGLRSLLRRELERHGFEGVEIAFDAPAKDWSGRLSGPAVNLFLYDLRHSTEGATAVPAQRRMNGMTYMAPPAFRLDLTYAVTAWTKAVEDEHRLLSQVLAILFSHQQLPDDILSASTTGAESRIGRPREDKADFWSAVGGQYKASLDYVVSITVESGVTFTRGPEVRTRSIRLRHSDGPVSTMEEFHGFGGAVRDGDGEPVAGAWIVVPELGLWTASAGDGRFRFRRVAPGEHVVQARTADGGTAEGRVTVPGAGIDLTIGAPRQTKSKAR
jgi:hypothetical protein